MSRLYLLSFLLAVQGFALAGTDGYLRQGSPGTLRIAKALPPPPPVDELILALDKPPVTETEKPATAPSPSPSSGLSDELKAVIDDLISKPAPARTDLTVDTAAPVPAPSPATAAPVDPVPNVPGVDALPPDNPQAEAARDLSDILTLFNTGNARRNRDRTTVMVAPPVFLPPQPAASGPPSRAVYRSP